MKNRNDVPLIPPVIWGDAWFVEHISKKTVGRVSVPARDSPCQMTPIGRAQLPAPTELPLLILGCAFGIVR